MLRVKGGSAFGRALGVRFLGLWLTGVSAAFAELNELRSVAASDFGPAAGVGEDESQNADQASEEFIFAAASVRKRNSSDLPFITEDFGVDKLLMGRQVRRIAKALAEVLGVMIQKPSRGQGPPYIQSFTDFRPLFFIDSIRLNNAVSRGGYWNTVDPFGLELRGTAGKRFSCCVTGKGFGDVEVGGAATTGYNEQNAIPLLTPPNCWLQRLEDELNPRVGPSCERVARDFNLVVRS